MKILTSIALGTLILCSASVSSSASIGRSSSVSVSRSVSAPSRPSVAPSAPSKPSYIGSGSQSIGVQKPAVTQAAQNKTPVNTPAQPARPSTPSYGTPATPAYNAAPVPTPSIASPVTNGSTFMSSLGGSFVGSALGNVLFGHSGGSHSSTTVVNNGGGSTSSGVAPSSSFTDSNGFTSIPSSPKASYGMFNFLGDLIGFILIIGVIGAFVYGCRYVWLRYNALKKEEMIISAPAFIPATKFWSIQRAFMSADIVALETLLGSGLKHEITSGLTPSESEIKNMSYMTVLHTSTENSVRYDFLVDGERVAQVWHFELENNEWALNGIENLDI